MNAQIYQFLSDVMSRMGEAITNIRTVRACSSEEYESQRNEDGLRKALVAGIKDAFANGLTAACAITLSRVVYVRVRAASSAVQDDTRGDKNMCTCN